MRVDSVSAGESVFEGKTESGVGVQLIWKLHARTVMPSKVGKYLGFICQRPLFLQ